MHGWRRSGWGPEAGLCGCATLRISEDGTFRLLTEEPPCSQGHASQASRHSAAMGKPIVFSRRRERLDRWDLGKGTGNRCDRGPFYRCGYGLRRSCEEKARNRSVPSSLAQNPFLGAWAAVTECDLGNGPGADCSTRTTGGLLPRGAPARMYSASASRLSQIAVLLGACCAACASEPASRQSGYGRPS